MIKVNDYNDLHQNLFYFKERLFLNMRGTQNA